MSTYLSELCRFYERMAADPASGMPPRGMTAEQISFALVIAEDGALVRVEDLRDSKGRPVRRFVPAAVKRTSGIAANFLWDNTGYALGVDGKGNAERAAKTFAAFRALHEKLLARCEGIQARALLAFLDTWDPQRFAALELRDALLDSNVVFRLDGEDHFLHEDAALEALWLDAVDEGEEATAAVQGPSRWITPPSRASPARRVPARRWSPSTALRSPPMARSRTPMPRFPPLRPAPILRP